MPRPVLAERLGDVIAAAADVFADRGYRRALMADIATAAGLSPGALYRYVESKDALFLLLFTGDKPPLNFPVATPSPRQLIDAIANRLAVVGDTPALDAALANPDPIDVHAELEAVLAERYDLVATNWPLLAVVERSAPDLPDLFDLYFHAGRRHLTDKLASYLDRRTANGAFRPTPYPQLTARFIEESLTWFAWHRHHDPDSAHLDDTAARTTAISMNLMSLIQ